MKPFSDSDDEPFFDKKRPTNRVQKNSFAEGEGWPRLDRPIIRDEPRDYETDELARPNASSVSKARKTRNWKQLTIFIPYAPYWTSTEVYSDENESKSWVRVNSFAEEDKWPRFDHSIIRDETRDYKTDDRTRHDASSVSKNKKTSNWKLLKIFVPFARYFTTTEIQPNEYESEPSAKKSSSRDRKFSGSSVSEDSLEDLGRKSTEVPCYDAYYDSSSEVEDDQIHLSAQDSPEIPQEITAENPFRDPSPDSCADAEDDQAYPSPKNYREISAENPFSDASCDSGSVVEDDLAYPSPKNPFEHHRETAKVSPSDASPNASEDPLDGLDRNVVIMIFIGITVTFCHLPEGEAYCLMNRFLHEDYPYVSVNFDEKGIEEIYEHLKVEQIKKKYCDMDEKRIHHVEKACGLSCYMDRIEFAKMSLKTGSAD